MKSIISRLYLSSTFCAAEINNDHLTSENGKLAAFASGRPAFRQHAKRTEGSDTPRLARSESTAHRVKKQQHHQVANRSRSPAGPRRLGTATRISASLFRRLSAFFGSTPDQAPKAAKLAVLIPGPGRFANVQLVSRVVIAAPSGRPVFRRVCRCVRFFSERRVCTRFRVRKQTWGVCARS